MRWRSLALLCLLLVAALRAGLASAAESVCAESFTIETTDGTITARLIGEDRVSDAVFVPALFPAIWLGPIRTAVGWYQLPDGQRVSIGCLGLAS
jgi:hypothetical protein